MYSKPPFAIWWTPFGRYTPADLMWAILWVNLLLSLDDCAAVVGHITAENNVVPFFLKKRI